MIENKKSYKVKIPIKEKDSGEKLEMELLSKEKNENLLRGFIKINNVYLSYSFIMILDDIKYYINFENGNGTHRFKFSDLSATIARLGNRTLDDFLLLVNRCKFDYKLIKYNDINFIYVFNNKYKHMFDDNTYDDLS